MTKWAVHLKTCHNCLRPTLYTALFIIKLPSHSTLTSERCQVKKVDNSQHSRTRDINQKSHSHRNWSSHLLLSVWKIQQN